MKNNRRKINFSNNLSKIILLIFALSIQSFASNELPDWSGVWERYEDNGGMFDIATTEPKNGRAGNIGVRQFPPLTPEWEEKYKRNLESVSYTHLTLPTILRV